jgi:uncharacterized FlaG/YvyC family protein
MAIESLTGATAIASTPVAQATTGKGNARARSEIEPATPAPAPSDTIQSAAEDVEQADSENQTSAVTEARQKFAESSLSSDLTKLSIRYDEDIDVFVSARVEAESGEVVRQFPYEEQIERIRHFQETNGGKLDISA